MLRLFCAFLFVIIIASNSFGSVKIVPSKEKVEFKHVGKIVQTGSGAAGSAILLWTGEHVITAYHNISKTGKLSGEKVSPHALIFTLPDGSKSVIDTIYSLNNYDVAVLKLKKKFEPGHKIYSKNVIEEKFYAAGYGQSSINPTYRSIKWNLPYGKMRTFENTIDSYFMGIYLFDLDAPESLGKKFGAIPGEGYPGFGDSGGGMFVKENEDMMLIGIITQITNKYPYVGFGKGLPDILPWIEKVVLLSSSDTVTISANMSNGIPFFVTYIILFVIVFVVKHSIY